MNREVVAGSQVSPTNEADLSGYRFNDLLPEQLLLVGAARQAIIRASAGETEVAVTPRIPRVWVADWCTERNCNAYNSERPITWLMERGSL